MGVREGNAREDYPLRYGMHVFDSHDQLLGTVLLVRKDHFVIRQELGINQIVLLPCVAISGVVGSMAFLNMTPGEIEMFGKVLERRERNVPGGNVRARVARPLVLSEAT